MSPKMNDELTTKMHSEFSISPEKELELTIRAAVQDKIELKYSIEKICNLYKITEKQIETYLNNEAKK